MRVPAYDVRVRETNDVSRIFITEGFCKSLTRLRLGIDKAQRTMARAHNLKKRDELGRERDQPAQHLCFE